MTSVATQAKLWYWQRMSAAVLAVCVLVHLAVNIYAVRGGLSAAEILGRTHGNWLFGAFYGVFVLACAVHVPLGVATVAAEWLGWRGRSAIRWTLGAFSLLVLAYFGTKFVLEILLTPAA